MQLMFTVLPDAVLKVICQVLIHSLWQGLIAGVLAALIVTFTKRSSAVVRYNLLLAVLLLFVIGTTITAALHFRYRDAGNSALTAGETPHLYSPSNLETGYKQVTSRSATQTFLERGSTWCNDHASILVLIWFSFFLIKCSQLIASFGYMQRIRCRNNYEVTSYWKNRLWELAQKTGLKSAVIFLESELIQIPAVIGYLKPVLLVPAGLLCNLPIEQVEAILLHELAHIRRRDFLVNLLQNIIETFFFFNPAITWISSLVREEREACCDDMVIAHIPQKTNYLQALVSFQELQLYSNSNVLALTGNKHYLLNRVRRMLTLENKKLNLMEKIALILSIVGFTAFGFIAKDKPEPAPIAKSKVHTRVTTEPKAFVPMIILKKPVQKQKKPALISLPKRDIDTVPKTTPSKGELSFPNISSNSKSDGKTTETQVEATDNEGRHYSLIRIDGQITSLAVNGTVVPKNKYDDYSELIARIDEAQNQRISKRKQDLELRKQDLMLKQKEMMEKRTLEYDQKKAEILENQKLYAEKRAEILQNQKLYEQKKLEVLQNQKLYQQKKADMIQSKKLYRQGGMNDDIIMIIADLGDQNLVKDENNLSFSLNDKELVVDGKKQPAKIHQQFKEKYIQNNRDRFIYSKKGNSTSITINKE